ncbi:MAG: lytic murein transglycosylase B [Gammaproteobacteria bacterium]|nr:MAG: lytic murein transglycosylase B [Gammaproteobacteria bacterium]
MKKNLLIKTLIIIAGISFISAPAISAATAKKEEKTESQKTVIKTQKKSKSKKETPFHERKDVKKFITSLVKKDKLNKKELLKIFKDMKPRPEVISSISKPAESKKWFQYRPIFLNKSRIKLGANYWGKHRKTLLKAEKDYGVPPEMVTAIIGVETKYGAYFGNHRVIDSLATLGFMRKRRGKFFRSELREFLLLAKEHDLDPLKVKGSYAGAMGKPQFISSSYRNYAIDYDGDKKINLWDSDKDVIGSVANYFERHKWNKGQPIAVRAKIKGKKYKKLLNNKLNTRYSLATLKKYGVTPKNKMNSKLKANLLELEYKKGKKEYWITFDNFYVITRYNHSHLYAMAAYQLGEKIKARRKALDKAAAKKKNRDKQKGKKTNNTKPQAKKATGKKEL